MPWLKEKEFLVIKAVTLLDFSHWDAGKYAWFSLVHDCSSHFGSGVWVAVVIQLVQRGWSISLGFKKVTLVFRTWTVIILISESSLILKSVPWVNKEGNFKSFCVAVTFVLLLACFWNMGFHCVAIKEFIKISCHLCEAHGPWLPSGSASGSVMIISCGTPRSPSFLYWICYSFPPAFLSSDSILCARMCDNWLCALLGEENIH